MNCVMAVRGHRRKKLGPARNRTSVAHFRSEPSTTGTLSLTHAMSYIIEIIRSSVNVADVADTKSWSKERVGVDLWGGYKSERRTANPHPHPLLSLFLNNVLWNSFYLIWLIPISGHMWTFNSFQVFFYYTWASSCWQRRKKKKNVQIFLHQNVITLLCVVTPKQLFSFFHQR